MTIKQACIEAANAPEAMAAIVIISTAVGIDIEQMATEAGTDTANMVTPDAVASWDKTPLGERVIECMKIAAAITGTLLPISYTLDHLRATKAAQEAEGDAPSSEVGVN